MNPGSTKNHNEPWTAETLIAALRKMERDRILALFTDLALALDKKAEECGDDNDEDVAVGLTWTAAASSVRRVCDEAVEQWNGNLPD